MKNVIGFLLMIFLVPAIWDRVVDVYEWSGRDIEVVKETQPFTKKLIEEYEAYRDDKSNKPVKHGYVGNITDVDIYKNDVCVEMCEGDE